MALWWSTSTCGAHRLLTSPQPSVHSTNPSGRSAWRSGSSLLTLLGSRTTDLSSPMVISLICSSEWLTSAM
uniref:Uncharacterized protein n=1 Tax=Triticum urartu TaxID=4572 RepID=A0A8R7QVV7_TRIUA